MLIIDNQIYIEVVRTIVLSVCMDMLDGHEIELPSQLGVLLLMDEYKHHQQF